MKKNLIILWLVVQPCVAFQPVDINQANFEQIALLPGLGEKLARRIVSYRQKILYFKNEKDLLAIEGITESRLKKITPLLLFNIPAKKKIKVNLSKILLSPKPKPIIELALLEKHMLNAMDLKDDWQEIMTKRARRSVWLPKLSLGLNYDHDVDSTEKKITNSDNTLLKRGGHDLGFGIRLAFDFSELIFHQAELEIASLFLKRLEKREKLIERLHNYYFRYVALEQTQENHAELQNISAILDSMSNKAFSKFQEGEQ